MEKELQNEIDRLSELALAAKENLNTPNDGLSDEVQLLLKHQNNTLLWRSFSLVLVLLVVGLAIYIGFDIPWLDYEYASKNQSVNTTLAPLSSQNSKKAKEQSVKFPTSSARGDLLLNQLATKKRTKSIFHPIAYSDPQEKTSEEIEDAEERKKPQKQEQEQELEQEQRHDIDTDNSFDNTEFGNDANAAKKISFGRRIVDEMDFTLVTKEEYEYRGDLTERTMCTFDPIGANVLLFEALKTISLNWGVKLELKSHTDQRVAVEDFKSGVCDLLNVSASTLRRDSFH